MNRYAILAGSLATTGADDSFTPTVSRSRRGRHWQHTIATAIKRHPANLRNPEAIVNVLGIGMVLVGLLLGLGLRQEFLGFRLAIGGGLALLTIHVIVPMLLQYI
jgi:uncharacterized membrane protein YkgB